MSKKLYPVFNAIAIPFAAAAVVASAVAVAATVTSVPLLAATAAVFGFWGLGLGWSSVKKVRDYYDNVPSQKQVISGGTGK
jgi:hypothetical protein